MSTGKSLYRQFTIRVRELNDQGLQPDDIQKDSEVERLGLALFGANAFKRILLEEIKRALQTDIDEITGERNRVAVPQPKLPMPEPEAEPTPDSGSPSRGAFLTGRGHTWEPKANLDDNPEKALLVIEETNKLIYGIINRNHAYIDSEKNSIFNGIKKAAKAARLRLAS